MRASKDLAKRLRFDRFPRGDRVRRHSLLASVGAVAAGLAVWMAFSSRLRERQYMPGPVAQSHATFGDRCERCHDAFRGVQDTACLKCHAARTHSQFEAHTPPCRDCHVEHRGEHLLRLVSTASCIECHGRLTSKRPQALINTTISSFATHPQFVPLRAGQHDTAALRFNHKLHFASDKIARDDKLGCGSCHRPASDGRLMQPIRFAPHCKRCHEQKPPNPFGGIEALHKTPEVVRADLQAQLLMVAAQNPEGVFKGQPSMLPGVSDRPPLSAASTLHGYQSEWLEKLEAALYAPFDETPPLLEHNKYCFLCHVEQGRRAPGQLAQLRETKIPQRWLERGGFSHRKHDALACKTCHAAVEKSELTSDTNLPAKELCTKCHVDGSREGAGTDCVLCHLYHDTSKNPELRTQKRREVTLEVLTGSP